MFEVSVRELAETEGSRRIGLERGEGWHRLGLGAELHARVLKQRRRDRPDYQSEVPLRARWPVEDWTALISGRLDGCAPQAAGGWLIEEFKSGYLPASDPRRAGGGFESHQRQLLIYCHLWRRLGHSPVSGSLVYVDLATAEELPVPVAYDEDSLERRLHARLRELLALWRNEAQARRRKAAAAAAMPFPHDAPRPGQQLMIDAVRQALETGGHLLAEAPTGSGKTAASLYPAMLHGLAAGRQVVFLTSKTLQQKMAVSILRALNAGGAFRTAQIRAKEKMCANDRVLCHEDFCPYARNYPEKMEKSALLDRLRGSLSHFDPDAVFAEAKREKVCPFEVQLELARRADAITADYNYVFDPGAALSHLDREGLPSAILLVDEAHNLPDRARKIFSPELLQESFRDVAGRVLLQQGRLFEALSTIVEEVAALLRESAAALEGAAPIGEVEPPVAELRELWKRWEPEFVRYLSWKRELKLAPAEDLDCGFAFRLAAVHGDPQFVRPRFCLRRGKTPGGRPPGAGLPGPGAGHRAGLQGGGLGHFVFRHAGAHRSHAAGARPGKRAHAALSLPPPFPRENRKVMILPQVRTTFAARAGSYGTIAGLVAQMSCAQRGNGLVLFPSYQFLEQVVQRMPPLRAALIVQRPNLGGPEREAIFQSLASPRPKACCSAPCWAACMRKEWIIRANF